jgi:predicted DNA-binding protein YlxM (UPF0122 family)
MNIKELLKVFGSASEMARAFNVSRQAVSKWIKAGELPALRQYQAQVLLDMRRLKR